MNAMKALGGTAVAAVGIWILAALGTLVGVGPEGQLLGSESQLAALVTAAFTVAALAGYAALGRPWRDAHTPYW